MKPLIFAHLLIIGVLAFLPSSAIADSNASDSIGAAWRVADSQKDLISIDRAKSFTWCSTAVAEARARCVNDCAAAGGSMTNFDGGFCGIGAKCTCDVSVEQPPDP